jgi:hypothetical protein
MLSEMKLNTIQRIGRGTAHPAMDQWKTMARKAS